MHPESIQTVSNTVDGALKRHIDVKEQHHTVSNGSDNIITITTGNSIREYPSVEATITRDDNAIRPPHKHQSAHTIASAKIVEFLKSQHSTPSNQPPAHAAHDSQHLSATQHTAHQTAEHQFRFCRFSEWISFQDHIADVHHRKGRRLNGFQLPLHPLQLFGWLVLVLFGFAAFWVLIPAFVAELQGPLYGLISGLYIVHIASHLAALLIDPADRELRRVHRNDRIVPEFDRSKHTHVIENGRCHLCNIRTTSPRTKHCSVCNKCVGKFDHHCKWLNHCIGSRNYVAFLMCVVSAVIATLVIVAAVIAQIVLYYVQPQWLSYWQAASVTVNTSTATAAQPSLPLATSVPTNAVPFAVNDGNNSNVGGMEITYDLIGNVSIGLKFGLNVTTNTTAFPLEDDGYLGNTTLPALIENVTTLVTEFVNDSLLLNLSSAVTPLDADTAAAAAATIISSNNATVTIAGISISDTIFLILIGFLGLLAAITAGLLLHLCFFHIYISFLGLTTYEYIRNHRQAQEAKTKHMQPSLSNNGQQQPAANYSTTISSTPSKKTNNCGQIYFCSRLRHPNDMDPADLRYFETHKPTPLHGERLGGSKLHCCANSREYHQTALKTYYMCSLLEENATNPTLGIAHISGNTDGEDYYNESDDFDTFHCCSAFAATATQRKVSAATTKATLVSDLEATLSARRSYMQYTEQCTFCTYRIRSPMVGKRSSATSTRSLGGQSTAPTSLPTSQTPSATSKLTTTEHQRCCMKTISKQQRWRRKWYCCSNVPDSPDVPNDIIAALALRHQHSSATQAARKTSATEIPVHFIKPMNGSTSNGSGSDSSSTGLTNSRPTSSRNANVKVQTRTRNARTWPVARLRHIVRMLSRYRRSRCRHNSTVSVAEQIKQNQIRPLQLHKNNANGCQHYQQQYQHYDSSSPQPPSTTPTDRGSEYSDSSALTTPSSVSQPGAIETILPTSVIRADSSVTYTTPVGITLPPALPPPTRRKIPNPTPLEELAETLSFVANPSSGALTLSPAQRLPALNNVYRRQRRKHFLRTRSPTLSPIHESGLSNPTSPQPCRHNSASSCAPNTAVAAAAAVVNNLCGSTELMRKASSNSSLHSVSSNSSST